MIDYFNFDGSDSRDLGIVIKNHNSYDRPEKNVELIEIPGRNGNIIRDNNNYKNINIWYNCRIFTPDCPDFLKNKNVNVAYSLKEISNVLKADGDYHILIDSFHPNYFRKATFFSGISFDNLKNRSIIDGTFQFSCKPQLFRTDGEKFVKINFGGTNTGHIYNPETESAKPIIRIYTSGVSGDIVLFVNGKRILISSELNNIEYFEIDCETMNVSHNGTNYNKYATLNFPTLDSGYNDIVLVNGVTNVYVKGRWFMI